MITEDYVSFETAKLLKEKGFDERCTHYYKNEKYLVDLGYTNINSYTNSDLVEEFTAPTLQMAMKWLRENHNFYVTSVPNGIGEEIFYPWVYKKFEWGWTPLESSLNGFQKPEFNSPEEACEAAIKYCLVNLV